MSLFNLSFLNVATKANPRGGVGTSTGRVKSTGTRTYPNLSFTVRKTKKKERDEAGNEISVDVLKGTYKFSKKFFEKAKINTHTVSIYYAEDKENKKVYILTTEGEGVSCNYNAGKSKDGKKSQEFRSLQLEEFLQNVGILPAELPENFRQELTLTKIDTEATADYLEVYEISLAKEGEGDVEDEEEVDEVTSEISDSEVSETQEVEEAEEVAEIADFEAEANTATTVAEVVEDEFS